MAQVVMMDMELEISLKRCKARYSFTKTDSRHAKPGDSIPVDVELTETAPPQVPLSWNQASCLEQVIFRNRPSP